MVLDPLLPELVPDFVPVEDSFMLPEVDLDLFLLLLVEPCFDFDVVLLVLPEVDILLESSLSEFDISVEEVVLPDVDILVDELVPEVVPDVVPEVDPVVEPSVLPMVLPEVMSLVLEVEDPPVSVPVVEVVFAKFCLLLVLLSLLQEKSIKLPETNKM